MTRRERLEAKAARRRGWADGRRAKAAPLLRAADRYRGDVAFNTQPGHIPERARVIAAVDRGLEHARAADAHDAKADGLDARLDRSVFSDDADAVERLRERIATNEAKRARMKAVNAAIRRGPGWQARLEAAGLTLDAGERADLLAVATHQPYYCDRATGAPTFPPYALSNLGARIRADRERIAVVEARAARSTTAEAGGGVLIEGPTGPSCGLPVVEGRTIPCMLVAGHAGAHGPSSEWVRVTFAEKPARDVLAALRAAGFRWGGGSWAGPRAKLPACVKGGAA